MGLHHSPRIVTDGLVLCLDAADKNSYPGNGNTWYDLSGNGYNGTLTNGPSYSSESGGSLVFDGSNDYVTLLGDGANDNVHAWTQDGSVGSSTLCMEIWVKIGENDTNGSIISKPWNGNGRYNISVAYNSFSLKCGNDSRSIIYFSNNLSTNTWRHLVVWANSTNMGYYIDGGLYSKQKTHSIIGGVDSIGNSNLPLGLMTLYFYGEGWGGIAAHAVTGNIGVFKKYNRILNASEIQQNYNATKSRFGL